MDIGGHGGRTGEPNLSFLLGMFQLVLLAWIVVGVFRGCGTVGGSAPVHTLIRL